MDHNAKHYCYILRTLKRGTFYIGATNNPDRRYESHVKVVKNPKTPLQNAINDAILGGETVYMDVVFSGGRIECFAKERELIIDARNKGVLVVNTFRYVEHKSPTQNGFINYTFPKAEGAP